MKASCLLILFLITALLLPTTGLGETITFPDENVSVSFTGLAICGESAYLWEEYSGTLYELSTATGSKTGYRFGTDDHPVPIYLLEVGGALHAVCAQINPGNGSYVDAGLYRLSLGGDNTLTADPVGKLNLAGFLQEQYGMVFLPTVKSAALDGNALYANLSGSEEGVFSFDLSTGVCAKLPLDGAESLIAAQGGMLMLALRSSDGELKLSLYNTADKKRSDLCSLPNNTVHFAYDAQNATLYYLADGLYRLTDPANGSPEFVTTVPLTPIMLFACNGSIFALSNDMKAYAAPVVTSAQSVRTLKCYGGCNRKTEQDYLLARPGLKYEFLHNIGQFELLSQVLSRSAEADVFILNSDSYPSFCAMRDKGFLAAIDDSAIQSYVDSVYPSFRAECYDPDGVLRAIPVGAVVQPCMGYNEPLWQSLNLGKVPTTWDEMLTFLDNWCRNPQQYPETMLMNYESATETRSMLIGALQQSYNTYRTGFTPVLSYQTEIFENLLTRLMSIPFENLDYRRIVSATDVLFTDSYIPSPSNNLFGSDLATQLPLTIDPSVPHKMDAVVYFFCINPDAKNFDLAMDYATFTVQNMSPDFSATMCPGFNQAVYESQHAQREADYESRLDDLQKQWLATTDPASLTAIELEIDALVAEHEVYLSSAAFSISPETLEQYHHDVGTDMAVRYGAFFSDETMLNNWDEKCEKFIHGSLSVKEYLQALDQVYYMQEMELQ